MYINFYIYHTIYDNTQHQTRCNCMIEYLQHLQRIMSNIWFWTGNLKTSTVSQSVDKSTHNSMYITIYLKTVGKCSNNKTRYVSNKTLYCIYYNMPVIIRSSVNIWDVRPHIKHAFPWRLAIAPHTARCWARLTRPVKQRKHIVDHHMTQFSIFYLTSMFVLPPSH